MSQQSLISRYDIFFATSTLTANANGYKNGFRQRDVRFFIELFTNFVDPSSAWEGLPIQNTHIYRYLNNLVSEGYVRKLSKKTHPNYRLNRIGLIELFRSLVAKPYYHDHSHFFFVYGFIENYSPRFLSLVKREGEQFPYAMKLELEELINLEILLKKQIDFTKKELLALEKRIEEQQKTKEMCEELLARNVPFEQATLELEQYFPYAMNTQKTLSEFMAEGTVKQAIWEVTIGGPRRSEQIWKPARDRLLLHLEQLETLGEQTLARQRGELI